MKTRSVETCEFSYVCETWPLTLREEHRLRLFENRVLRGIFGPKREEVVGGWRRLHNEELHNLYTLPDIIRVMKRRGGGYMGRRVRRMEEMRNAYKFFVGKPRGKRPFRKPRRRWWEDNIGMDLRGRVGRCGSVSSGSG
jgi:hypothetical protein